MLGELEGDVDEEFLEVLYVLGDFGVVFHLEVLVVGEAVGYVELDAEFALELL